MAYVPSTSEAVSYQRFLLSTPSGKAAGSLTELLRIVTCGLFEVDDLALSRSIAAWSLSPARQACLDPWPLQVPLAITQLKVSALSASRHRGWSSFCSNGAPWFSVWPALAEAPAAKCSLWRSRSARNQD